MNGGGYNPQKDSTKTSQDVASNHYLTHNKP